MKQTVKMWKCKLEKEIKEYTKCPMTPDKLAMVDRLGQSWMLYDDMWCRLNQYEDPEGGDDDHVAAPEYHLTEDDIRYWNDNMMNADNTQGGHWTEDQTTSLAGSVGVYFEHLTPLQWNVACNMMYSDYCQVAKIAGISDAEFFGNMAKAFLFDRDGPGPQKKLCKYYHYIVMAK